MMFCFMSRIIYLCIKLYSHHNLVLPKPTRGVTAATGTDDAWLPQWAVAVMVIGLASLLFVLIFGITVVFIFEIRCPILIMSGEKPNNIAC